MTHSLRPLAENVYAAVVGADLVFFDVGRDTYHCLPDVGAGLAAPFSSHLIASLPEDIAAELLGAGLLAPERRLDDEALLVLAPVQSDLAAPGRVRASLAERVSMMAAVFAMARHFHGRPLSYLLARARRRYARAQLPLRAPGSAEARRVQVFRELLPWAPGQGACLYRCALLLTFLRQAGLDAHWVFGVRTWPFSAHCWLQAGDVVFDDPADYVGRFTPILVV
ncbi:MAG: lasso peptide biosynthesis B2 protein [Pseudomonadota bacterium]